MSIALALAAAAAGGCRPRVPPEHLERLSHWPAAALRDDGPFEPLRDAVAASIGTLAGDEPSRPVPFGDGTTTLGDVLATLELFDTLLAQNPDAEALGRAVRRYFDLYRPAAPVTVTGYYQPVLEAAREADPRYPIPLYRRPGDLVDLDPALFAAGCEPVRTGGRVDGGRLVPYYTRAQIEAGALAGRGLEIAWLPDSLSLYILQLQGSGTLRLRDGTSLQVGFAASNGHPYRSIAPLVAQRLGIDTADLRLPTLHRFLRTHPAEGDAMLRSNDRYVFFRRLDGPVVGSLGAPLTPLRSVAVDTRIYPPGGLGFLRTTRPRFPTGGDDPGDWEPLARFVLFQDSGAAIRGPGRLDLFWGEGPEAGRAAGAMRQAAELYLLVPRSK